MNSVEKVSYIFHNSMNFSFKFERKWSRVCPPKGNSGPEQFAGQLRCLVRQGVNLTMLIRPRLERVQWVGYAVKHTQPFVIIWEQSSMKGTLVYQDDGLIMILFYWASVAGNRQICSWKDVVLSIGTILQGWIIFMCLKLVCRWNSYCQPNVSPIHYARSAEVGTTILAIWGVYLSAPI